MKQLFETSIQQSEENRKLREQIVENDHHNYFKINEEQNRASDARFKYDGDRLALEQARLEYDRMKLENTELKELAESIRDEYIGLNSQEKIYQDEFVRIENKLNSQKKKFNELTEIYIEVKQKNDILNKEREKREEIYKKRLEDAIEKRDNLKNFIDDVKNQQKEADEAVEAAKNKIEDLIFDRDRLDSEIQHLIQMKERRNEQQIQFNLLLNNV
ncbi:hypothetical protein TRFO_26098 [Tritrichomonas foetus]|uniref:Uncharacterized protein n=1 Tax=Tritrichomonas foetus TaxID=1144522 RepID=A0A1J4K3E0_9EUKA|nr:hypothetical protein TRFO_26098 [Tritrichomonas foetus]|eukprot:OHT05961.1 hypothetical protein TRFO_26098 [Tritrichomonas foetus]